MRFIDFFRMLDASPGRVRLRPGGARARKNKTKKSRVRNRLARKSRRVNRRRG